MNQLTLKDGKSDFCIYITHNLLIALLNHNNDKALLY